MTTCLVVSQMLYKGDIMFSFRSLLLFVSHIQLSFSALPANGDRVETVGWQSDPNGRGTFTLVSSCVLTLTICVYSAMHLNVPPLRESTFQFWLRNIKWGLLGIFGPELVIFIAWKQYLSAKTIMKTSQDELHTGNSISQRGQVEKQSTMVMLSPVCQPKICYLLRWRRDQSIAHHRALTLPLLGLSFMDFMQAWAVLPSHSVT